MIKKALGKLLSRGKHHGPPLAPGGLRLYAIGDIHGRDDLLEQLIDKICLDAGAGTAARNILIYLGDYVDRGLQSRQVLDRLVSGPPPGFEAVYLKGNHEDALLQFLDDAQFAKTWKYYGGLETLHSYGVTDLTLSDDARLFEQARDRFETVLPLTHRKFLDQLALSATFGDYFFAHAGVRPGIDLDRQSEQDLMWIRDDFLHSKSRFGKTIVHGHTPSEDVVFRPNRIGIDTGAYMTNNLTCLVLEATDRRLLQTNVQT
jgi:serine/threonine protein phosphatase 1